MKPDSRLNQCSNKLCSLSHHKAQSKIEVQATTVTVNFTVTTVTSKVKTNLSYINVLTIPVMLSYHKAKLEVQQQLTTVTFTIVNIQSNWQISSFFLLTSQVISQSLLSLSGQQPAYLKLIYSLFTA